MKLHQILKKSKEATNFIANLPNNIRQNLLKECAELLEKNAEKILQANAKDLKNAKELNLNKSMIERLSLDNKKILNLADSLRKIADFQDPLNRILDGFTHANGLDIQRVSVPIGVIAIIYESRPNVTSDTAALCLKSGNVCILKGGKEAQNSNEAIMQCFHDALAKYNLPLDAITLLPSMQNREDLKELLHAKDYIDVIIPRGGEGLINFVSEHSKIPVIKHDKGICHIYAHHSCKIQDSIAIIINAKTSRPSTCNACETLLVDQCFAKDFLPKVALALKSKGTLLKGCEESHNILKDKDIECELITTEAYHTEYNDNILNLKVVPNFKEALLHIKTYGSGHSDAILCEDYTLAEEFLNQIDSACVYVNASTRFSDGEEFGYGAEVGISTARIHARGPMGIESLTTYKYKIRGNGQIR
ncbi:MAG: glutamate-5-semialdehyde dehydrogenase [Helicobacter sp.]|nr:glutamate-5-semialdehyde dehydrogenase [Helicobacter sp.]